MKILKTPWEKDFIELIKNSKTNIRATSPYIKENICNKIVDAKNKETNFKLITSFKIKHIHNRSLDIAGLETLINNNSTVKNITNLHSKIYVFDDKLAVISSSNLTNGGLLKNYEYGILLNEKKIVHEIIDDFEQLFTDNKTGTITIKNLMVAKEILNELQKTSTTNIYEPQSYDEIIDNDVIEIESNQIIEVLSGWKKDVFKIVNSLSHQHFGLNDIYRYEQYLSKKHPKNNNIKDKIRQQLQELRDLGLIEFLGNGKYRKLWKAKTSIQDQID